MRYLCIAILLTISVLLIADNQLDIVWQQHGEQTNDNFGMNVIAVDFNGDNIDDLAVNAYRYYIDPENVPQRGKLYIFFGSESGLSDTADVTISCPVDTLFDYRFHWLKIENLGDMNGDGCDEIGYIESERTYDGEYHTLTTYNILEGNTVNDTIPDHSYDSGASYSDIDLHPLGDINGDGYDDAGITEKAYPGWLTYSIIYGGSFEKVVFVDSLYTNGNLGFYGLGDVNNDGYDDFSYCYEEDSEENQDGSVTFNYFMRFFWGSTVQDTIPDEVLHYQKKSLSFSHGHRLVPAGDWDGDGYDDFALTIYDLNENYEAVGTRLWRGGETIDWDRYTYIESSNFFVPAIGDVNGDQKTDLVDTNNLIYYGYLYFYLGNQNGTRDFSGYNGHYGYGGGLAVGDFDNDGYDDIAVGAYGQGTSTPSNYGDVYVYGGHAGLIEQDPTPTNDETVLPVDITFNAFPNPFNPEVSFEIKTDIEYHDLKIEIYNIRGQKVETLLTPLRSVSFAGGNNSNHSNGNKRGFPSSISWNAEGFSSGIYFCKLNAGDKTLRTQKVTLMK